MKTTDRKYTSGLRTPLIIQDLLLKSPIKILALFFFKYRIFFKLITAQYNINNFLGEILRYLITWMNFYYFSLGAVPIWTSREAVDNTEF